MKNMKQKTTNKPASGKGFGDKNYSVRQQGGESPVPKGKAQKVNIPGK